MSETRLSFKEMCAKFDVTPRTLRYYEYIELLAPDREGRSRFYTGREVARMTLILRGRRWGFSLEEIRQWLEIYDSQGSNTQMAVLVELADRQLKVLQQQRDELDAAMNELREMRDSVAAELGEAPAQRIVT
ncbi:MerR family DNA-binding transcriptional regulator [Pseudoruegeria sp. HB172150]|uniref:MerR family transcriptional regulator n=1 Tax=Pseudoruegeria sp. HB172150 TaxID=2721164 RepID=UPI0015531F93|nr:MerR family DNA-binding transcriptional regulator [Pseudoruegeria sp. HB172150]